MMASPALLILARREWVVSILLLTFCVTTAMDAQRTSAARVVRDVSTLHSKAAVVKMRDSPANNVTNITLTRLRQANFIRVVFWEMEKCCAGGPIQQIY